MRTTDKTAGRALSRRSFIKNSVAGGATRAAIPARAVPEQTVGRPGTMSHDEHRAEKILSRCGSEFGNVRRVR